MADKQATVYIVDLGPSMGDCHNGRTESDLDWGMRYMWDKITTTAQAARKTWSVGVLGVRTDETKNRYAEDENNKGYDNIAVLKELGPVSLPEIKDLKARLRPSGTESGDAMSAIVLATEMINEFTTNAKGKPLLYKREVYLITDGTAAIDDDDVDEIADRLNDVGVKLTVVGVDFDDSEYGFKEEDKPTVKEQNERTLKSLVDKCKDGLLATMAEAVEALATPRVKLVHLVKKYEGPLTLGNPEAFPTALSFNVVRWPVTKVSAAPSASTVVLKSDLTGTQSTTTLDNEDGLVNDSEFNSVKQHRSYKVHDPTAPGEKREVEFEELERGYSYGSTAVHVAEAEWDVTKLETFRDFSIIGFIANDKIEPFVGLGDTSLTLANPSDTNSTIGLSALIHALYELDQCAIARFVTKNGKDPEILLLRPSVEPDIECLYDVPLPFAEDARLYRFPPLDKVMTITGKTLTEHRLLPDDKLMRAMGAFVESMDISALGRDNEGNPAEYAPLDDLYSPVIHRVNQAVRARAVQEDGPIEEIAPVLLKYSQPPSGVIKQAKRKIDGLIEAADVKKAPEKKKFRRQDAGKNNAPVSGLDIDSMLAQGVAAKKTKISKDNAVPDFKQVVQSLAEANEDDGIVQAVNEMGKIVQNLITESTGDSNYDRAAENIGVMREQMIGLELPELYNEFLKNLKAKLKSGALGGDRKEMWFKIRYPGKLGLITSAQSEASNVTDTEAQDFRHK
ncbi:unnamed protein product [Discula destructiva]